MLKLKFRAWDRDRKLMITKPEELHKVTYNETDNGFHMGNYQQNGDWQSLPIMLYTGHSDETGREIFEGDYVIVKHYIKPGELESESPVKLVLWNRDGFGLETSYEDGYRGYSWGLDIKSSYSNKYCQFLIVGNIYETPDLHLTYQHK